MNIIKAFGKKGMGVNRIASYASDAREGEGRGAFLEKCLSPLPLRPLPRLLPLMNLYQHHFKDFVNRGDGNEVYKAFYNWVNIVKVGKVFLWDNDGFNAG